MATERALSGGEAPNPALPLSDRTRRIESPALSHEDYTVAWICALALELTASRTMFDVVHDSLVAQRGDDNTYILGRVAHHNVVMVALPSAYGKVSAATVSTNLKRTFPNIAATLMVGVGGGAPGEATMRLGDVVVATRVIEYDLGKALGDGQFESTSGPKRPSQFLLSAVTALRSKHGQSATSSRMLELLQSRLADHGRPKQLDRLYKATYRHPAGVDTCEDCDRSFLQPRSMRPSTEPWIHYGGIASGDSVNKDAQKRDAISRKLGAVCFEMEAAGMMDNLHCLPIRGICDYSDSHKSKQWQPYAAATAAAFARELLETIQLPGATRLPPPALSGAIRFPAAHLSVASMVDKKILISLLDFPQIGARRAAIHAPQKKTCLWLLRHPLYLAWFDPDKQESHNGFLWIRGKAGAGKSTLMSFLYSETSNANGNTCVISYFFNARGKHLEKSITGMYRSLLKHLLFHMSDREWQQVGCGTEQSSFDKKTCPGFNQLKHMLRSAVLALENRPLICFIDALDECDEDDVRDMVCFFEDLAEDATEKGVHLHVCFSSRPYPYISIQKGLILTLEEEAGHTADLTQYVSKRLRVQDQYRAEFESQILAKASGIFMWVVLVVDILNKESSRGGLSLRRRLSEIPPGLSQLFKDILTRDEENPQDLRRCILWILCARYPLKPDEFRHAMWAAGLEDGRVDNDIPSGSDPESSKALAISSSKGLAEVTTGQLPVVQFIHESVRDFLVRDRGLQELWPDLGFEWEGPAHESIRNCCESYLNRVFASHGLGSFRDAIFLSGLRASDYLDEFAPRFQGKRAARWKPPFLDYADRELLYHINLAAPCLSQEAFLARLFGFESEAAIDYNKMVTVARVIQVWSNPKSSILEVFTHLELGNLVQLAVESIRAVEPRGPMSEQHRSAFFAAILARKSSMGVLAPLLGLSSLVYEGERVETTCRDLDKVHAGMTPLSWASENGYYTLAKVLIHNGESLVEEDSRGYTPLRKATRNNHFAVMRLLIESGLDMGTRDVTLAMHEELMNQNFEVARVLLKHYDGHDRPDDELAWILRLLPRAAGNAPLHIVEMLVGHAATANDGGVPELGFALRTAIIYGRADTVAFLIDRGADVNAQDSWNVSPLQTAVRHKQAAIVRLLLERGADPNVLEPGGCQPANLLRN